MQRAGRLRRQPAPANISISFVFSIWIDNFVCSGFFVNRTMRALLQVNSVIGDTE